MALNQVSGVPVGVLRVISYVILTYTRTFSNWEPIPFSKAHALSYTPQQSWEWSDAYSWRNDLWKINFKRVCKKPAGVLMVIWSGFLAPKRSFSKGAPTIFRKHMPSGMGTENLGMIGCIFAENGPLEGGIESSFWGTDWGAKGDFRWIFDPHPCIFEGGPPPFSESTCPQVWAQKVWGWSDVYSRRMGL